MKVLLLIAGMGSRLRPVTEYIPKCLVPVDGQPLLSYWLAYLTQNGITQIYLNLHYLAPQVEEFVNQSPWKTFVKFIYEPKLLGTAGTIKANAQLFFDKESLLVIHGDNLSYFCLSDFINAHNKRPTSCVITMMTFTTDQPQNCGIVKTNQDKVVTFFYEKHPRPRGNCANAAIYIIDHEVIQWIVKNATIDFSTEVIPKFLGRIATWHNEKYHRDIGNFISLLNAQWEIPIEIAAYKETNCSIQLAPNDLKTLAKKLADQLSISSCLYFETSKNVWQNLISETKNGQYKNASKLFIFDYFNLDMMNQLNTFNQANDLLLIGHAPKALNSKLLMQKHQIKSLIFSKLEYIQT